MLPESGGGDAGHGGFLRDRYAVIVGKALPPRQLAMSMRWICRGYRLSLAKALAIALPAGGGALWRACCFDSGAPRWLPASCFFGFV